MGAEQDTGQREGRVWMKLAYDMWARELVYLWIRHNQSLPEFLFANS